MGAQRLRKSLPEAAGSSKVSYPKAENGRGAPKASYSRTENGPGAPKVSGRKRTRSGKSFVEHVDNSFQLVRILGRELQGMSPVVELLAVLVEGFGV